MTNQEPIENNEEPEEAQKQGAPEPPAGYRPESAMQVPAQRQEPGTGGGPQHDPILESARRMTTAAQIMALVSLVIGGVFLSAAALIVAIMAFRKVKTFEAMHPDMPQLIAMGLSRTAGMAIVMSVLALGVNAAALAVMYPIIMEYLQTGDYSTLFGSTQPATSSSSSFWG